MEVFTNLINGFSFLTVFAKISILDAWQNSEFASEPSNDLQKKVHLRCLAGSSIHLCINHFRKTVAYLFTKFDQHIHHIHAIQHCARSSPRDLNYNIFVNNENYNSVS